MDTRSDEEFWSGPVECLQSLDNVLSNSDCDRRPRECGTEAVAGGAEDHAIVGGNGSANERIMLGK